MIQYVQMASFAIQNDWNVMNRNLLQQMNIERIFVSCGVTYLKKKFALSSHYSGLLCADIFSCSKSEKDVQFI